MSLRVYIGICVLAAALTFTGAQIGWNAWGGDGSGVEKMVGAALALSPAHESADGWVEYRTIVVFRNDDVARASDRQVLRAVNRIFIDEGVPVTLAVIPAPQRGPLVPGSEFCTYLRKLRRHHGDIFEIAQHGYTHKNISVWKGASEFGGQPYGIQYERVTRGRAVLEDCAGTVPMTFVPPGNIYGRTTARVLNDTGFGMVSGSAVVRDVFNNSGVFEAEGINHAFITASMVRDWGKPATFHSRAKLRESFDQAFAAGRVYVQVLHYQLFDVQRRLDKLRWLIDYMKRTGEVRFMTLGELSRRLDNGTARRTADGWAVRESGSRRYLALIE